MAFKYSKDINRDIIYKNTLLEPIHKTDLLEPIPVKNPIPHVSFYDSHGCEHATWESAQAADHLYNELMMNKPKHR